MIPYFTILMITAAALLSYFTPQVWSNMPLPVLMVVCVGGVILMVADLIRFGAIMQVHKQEVLKSFREKTN